MSDLTSHMLVRLGSLFLMLVSCSGRWQTRRRWQSHRTRRHQAVSPTTTVAQAPNTQVIIIEARAGRMSHVLKIDDAEELKQLFKKGGKVVVYLSATW